MKKMNWVIGLLLFLNAVGPLSAAQHQPAVSGTIMGGYRVIEIPPEPKSIQLTVFRGDYIKFKFTTGAMDPVLSIPALSIEQTLSADIQKAPYFKMKKTGTFPFSLGAVSGDITVIEYTQPNYRAIASKEAAELIKNIQPLVLDVRTPREYQQGHLKNSVLIPVQELQSRWKEIETHKNQDILIYCATGNRSTVASKILIDRGFKRIYNLRFGIYEWGKNNYPITR